LRIGKDFAVLDSTSLPLGVIAGVAIVAGVFDVVRFKIPNALTIPLIVSGLIYHGVAGGWPSLQNSLAGCGFNFLVVLALFLIGIMGAGDVKFMAGVGAWLGLPASAYVFLIAALATGAYSVGILVWQGGIGRAAVTINVLVYQMRQLGVLGRHLAGMERVEEIARQSDHRRRLVPFAAMVALGVVVLIAWKMFHE
jgi:Flp pilus assembly protein protease CpaA